MTARCLIKLLLNYDLHTPIYDNYGCRVTDVYFRHSISGRAALSTRSAQGVTDGLSVYGLILALIEYDCQYVIHDRHGLEIYGIEYVDDHIELIS